MKLLQHIVIKTHIIEVYLSGSTNLLFFPLASGSGVGGRQRRPIHSLAWSSFPQPVSGGVGEGTVMWPGCYRLYPLLQDITTLNTR